MSVYVCVCVCVCDSDIVYILFLNMYRYSNVYNNYFGTIFLGNMYIIILNNNENINKHCMVN